MYRNKEIFIVSVVEVVEFLSRSEFVKFPTLGYLNKTNCISVDIM